jgi:hypothetical protein
MEDEDRGELDRLAARLMDEVGARTELEARLARRLAVAFWKGERAERMEVALLDAAPRLRPPVRTVRETSRNEPEQRIDPAFGGPWVVYSVALLDTWGRPWPHPSCLAQESARRTDDPIGPGIPRPA